MFSFVAAGTCHGVIHGELLEHSVFKLAGVKYTCRIAHSDAYSRLQSNWYPNLQLGNLYSVYRTESAIPYHSWLISCPPGLQGRAAS